MVWKILLELLFVLVILFAGAPFWPCLKTPRHLHNMLSDPVELKRLIDHAGYDKLLADAQKVQAPPLGTFGDTITVWETAHYQSLSQTRNGLLLVVLVVLAASWWLGIWYLAVSLLAFFTLGFAKLPPSAKNNNTDHLASVILNLIKWRREDESACEVFCHQRRPEYRTLHDLLVSLEPEMVAEEKKQGAKRILVVDDEEAIRDIISAMLTSAGYECRTVAGGLDALALLESGEKFELLLTDLMNSPMDGLSLLERTKEKFPEIQVVVASAVNDEDAIRACIRSGAYEYLVEPFERKQLLATVSRALEDRRRKAENRDSRITLVEDILIRVGRTGYLTPVAALKPVSISGTTVRQATLYCMDEIESMGVKIGDWIEVQLGDDGKPQITHVVEDENHPRGHKLFQMPEKCPECGTHVVRDEGAALYRCVNDNCPARLREAILHFVSRSAMDIEGMDEALVDELIARGLVRSVADICKLTGADLLSLEHVNDRSVQDLLREIEASKHSSLDRVIYSLGIEAVDSREAQLLAKHFGSMDALMTASEKEIQQVYAVGLNIAQNLAGFFAQNTVRFFRETKNRDLVRQLRQAGLRL
jgi:CheY-like chemotaxis protein